MISHRYRCIYVKVPKCASTTLRDYLGAHCRARDTVRPFWWGGLLARRMADTARAIDLYPDYFTFSFVRNPFERFVSLYLHAGRIQQRRSATLYRNAVGHGHLGEFAELCAGLLQQETLWGNDIERFFAGNPDLEFGPRRIRLKYLRYEISHVRRQTVFLPDFNAATLFGVTRANGAPLHFIGRVESLERDFGRVRETLGMPLLPLMRSNAAAPAGVGARGYAAYYDGPTRRLVEALYARDLELLGYSFDAAAGGGAPGGAPRAAPRRAARAGQVELAWSQRAGRSVRRARLAAPARIAALVERCGMHRLAARFFNLRPILAWRRRRY